MESSCLPGYPSTYKNHQGIADALNRVAAVEAALVARCEPQAAAAASASILPSGAASFVAHFKALPPSPIQSAIVHRVTMAVQRVWWIPLLCARWLGVWGEVSKGTRWRLCACLTVCVSPGSAIDPSLSPSTAHGSKLFLPARRESRADATLPILAWSQWHGCLFSEMVADGAAATWDGVLDRHHLRGGRPTMEG